MSALGFFPILNSQVAECLNYLCNPPTSSELSCDADASKEDRTISHSRLPSHMTRTLSPENDTIQSYKLQVSKNVAVNSQNPLVAKPPKQICITR